MKRTSRTLPRMNWLIEQGIVHIGDEVYILSEPSKLATIVDDKNVKYNGDIMSLNEFGCMITGWKSIQIYAYIKIKGQKKIYNEFIINLTFLIHSFFFL